MATSTTSPRFASSSRRNSKTRPNSRAPATTMPIPIASQPADAQPLRDDDGGGSEGSPVETGGASVVALTSPLVPSLTLRAGGSGPSAAPSPLPVRSPVDRWISLAGGPARFDLLEDALE